MSLSNVLTDHIPLRMHDVDHRLQIIAAQDPSVNV